jgi:forespore regulator of the sigma-K checkpoint
MKAKMSVLYAVFILGVASFPYLLFGEWAYQVKAEESTVLRATNQEEPLPTPVRLTIVLQRVYLNGDVSEEVVTDSFWSMEDCFSKYDQWKLVNQQNDKLVFQKNMDDISPLLKANGYFGITEEGILTIFNGRPQNSKVIQSFFQIDMGKLESRKREQLMKGIPIKTKHRYEKVLETFTPYTIVEKQAK